jgi:hypothetical protein
METMSEYHLMGLTQLDDFRMETNIVQQPILKYYIQIISTTISKLNGNIKRPMIILHGNGPSIFQAAIQRM